MTNKLKRDSAKSRLAEPPKRHNLEIMPFSCSKAHTLARLFLNPTKAFTLLLLFFFHILSKLFSSLFWNDRGSAYDEEDLEEEEDDDDDEGFRYYKNIQGNHLVADIIDGGQGLHFLSENVPVSSHHTSSSSDYLSHYEEDQEFYRNNSSFPSPEDQEFYRNSSSFPSPGEQRKENAELMTKQSGDDKFLIFTPPEAETKKQLISDTLHDDKQGYKNGDDHHVCTVGSTSEGSSEWRSSITYRESAPEDPFSSSSYSVFHKHDEETMLLDKISAQTESLKSFRVEPSSIRKRVVEQLTRTTSRSKRPLESRHQKNPYHELESAYVGQMCLAWEILSCTYNNFRCKVSLLRQQGITWDPGFPAQVAQQFQQFQVLLRRYIENEPYEYGKRPEIYARIKTAVAPKLLIVPQIQDEEDEKDEARSSRIPSESFLNILENSIRTFMDFLKADKESCCEAMITILFRTRKAGSVDPALVKVMKKTYRKKKLKVKKLQNAGKCIKRRKKVTKEEEMEMLMCLIDLKVVARVLRMWDLTRQQVRWCEEKMTKLTLSNVGHLRRDSSPLFFPPH